MPGAPVNWFALVPGYKEAVEREVRIREESFLPFGEMICGLEVRQMTPRDLLILQGIESPFVVGGAITAEHIVRFLWILSFRFRVVRTWRDKWVRGKFIKRCRRLNVGGVLRRIDEYMTDTFQDAPGGSGRGPVASDWSGIAAIVDQLASAYHWREDDILQIPLKRIFQYGRIMRRREDPKAVFFNRRDEVRGAWLRDRNKQAQN